MPLPDNLLNPIPGANPGGENLRYAPVYDKIKEARREEDEGIPQGDWEREVKVSDPVVVTKLAVEALTNKSKDLQIAAWLAEAVLRREGYSGLKQGLDLLRGMLETFWEHLHPEVEDGDMELRAAPLEWVGNYFPALLYRQPLTKGEGYDWYKYKECRAVPSEEEAAANESKSATRNEKLGEGCLAPEAFDADVQSSPKQFYKEMVEGIEAAQESLQALEELSDSKFGRDAPSFSKLRSALEELHHLGRGFLKKKQEVEPDEAAEEAEEAAAEESAEAGGEEGAEGAAARPARGKKALTAEPADKEDAISRVMVAAKFWRAQEPANPAPYLMVRGMRWGELRASGSPPDQLLFEPPPSDLRQQMKRLSLEGNWPEVLEAAETAAALPCGRAWLDVHRYTVKACENIGGYEAVMAGVLSGLRGLLADYPQLPEMTLMDDTPAANAETLAWIRDAVTIAAAAPAAIETATALPMDPEASPSGEAAPPDVFQVANQMVQEGRAEAAIEMLANAVSNERSGRTRFQRMIQLASLCMATSHERIAYPILMELSEEIDRRKLEDWEPRPVIAQPLALLYRCLVRMETGDEELKKKVYDRVVRLDPVQAMACVK